MSISTVSSQQLSISVSGLSENKFYLYSLQGEKITLIDSVTSILEGKLTYSLNNIYLHPGLFRIMLEKNKWIDFVNDGQDVNIITNANNILDSIKVIKSESNRLFYSFIKLNKQYKSKSELLQLILARYPKDDDYYTTTQTKLTQIQKEYQEFVDIIAQKNPNSFIARYIKSAQLPVIDCAQPPEKQLAYLKAHALDNADFNSDELINSDLFSNKSIEYLTYYRNPQLPKELLEKEFMVAVDTILNKAKVNPLVYKHVVEYLLDGFKKFGFDVIINYIIENYVIKDDICIDEKLETALQRRMDQAKHFKIGATAPNIVSMDSSEKQVDLNSIKSDKILILFYASWCPHCQTLLPKINELYKNQKVKHTEVLAVSIDTNKTDWQKYVSSNGMNWINVSDLKGWNGPDVQDYFIYATPTMFLVDRDRKIIGRPNNIGDLKGVF